VAARLVLIAALFATAAPARAQTPSPTGPCTASVNVPPGLTAGIAVYDRRTGTFTEQSNAHTQFRSASVVKLLIALDHLWGLGPGYWGYTALSAADIVRIYRWILDSAPATLRDIVMGDLRASTRCGVEGFDQRFGIPASFQQPWAVKQGWSGFGESSDCANTTASAAGRRVTTAPGAGGDLARRGGRPRPARSAHHGNRGRG